jgi:hypothetical protein
VFHFGDVLRSASDVTKKTVCNFVMLMKCNQFSDVLGSIQYTGDVLYHINIHVLVMSLNH